MKLRLGKKKEKVVEEPKEELVKKAGEVEGEEKKEKKEKRKKKKKVEYYGSRWWALGLMIGLMLLSSLFFVSGRGGLRAVLGGDWTDQIQNWTQGWGWSRTYEYR
jgi:hypothetical protein